MSKTHLKVSGVDCRNQGQTEYEYSHQTACGYIRQNVTRVTADVTCFYCLRTDEMKAIKQVLQANELK